MSVHTMDGDGNAAASRHVSAGLAAGLDASVCDWTLGFAGGITTANVSVASRDSTTAIDSYTLTLALYGSRAFDAFKVRFGGAYGLSDISANRSVRFPGFDEQLLADYWGRTGQVFGEIGYGLDLGAIAVEPFAGLAYTSFATDAAQETGGVSALHIDATSGGVTSSTVGVRLGTVIALGETGCSHLTFHWLGSTMRAMRPSAATRWLPARASR